MRGISVYQKSKVQNASPEEVVTMLFREACKRLRRCEATDSPGGDWIRDLAHVREIFLELRMALDHEAAPELCRRLNPLYSWCINELIAAGRDRQKHHVTAVLRVAETLLEGWVFAVSQPDRQSA